MAAGAALGSIVPGAGTLIGAVVGAVGSSLGGFLAKHVTNNYTGDFLRYVS